MNPDVADVLLLDVREISLFELLDHDNRSGFDTALERLLTSNVCSNFNSFCSSI